jgi:hypothetical protein
MSILDKLYIVEMPSRNKWMINVGFIANHRAEYFAKEFDGDVKKSLLEDTLPIFEADEYEIEDWAKNNLDWDDVKSSALLVKNVNKDDTEDLKEGWMNGDVEIMELT